MSKDPVCGMTVEPSQAAGYSEFEGTPYYFCSTACAKQFEASPQRFAMPRQQAAAVPCCGFGMVRRTTQRGAA